VQQFSYRVHRETGALAGDLQELLVLLEELSHFSQVVSLAASRCVEGTNLQLFHISCYMEKDANEQLIPTRRDPVGGPRLQGVPGSKS